MKQDMKNIHTVNEMWRNKAQRLETEVKARNLREAQLTR